jgi:pimeloyl-ACP methyl ester carboxylesterase
MSIHSRHPVRALIRGLASGVLVRGAALGPLAFACGSNGVDATADVQRIPDGCDAESTPMPASSSPPPPALPPPEQTLEIDGESFDLFSAGPRSGEAVLLLHGFPDASEDYRAALPRLALAGYRAIAAIRRAPAAVSDVERPLEHGQRARAIVDALELERFHVAGGQLAWDVARVVDARVLSVVSVAISTTSSRRRATHDQERENRCEQSEHSTCNPDLLAH